MEGGEIPVSVRDRWKYSRLRPKNTATHTRYRNWLSTRYWARGNGKAPLPDRVSRAVTSRTPAVRNRINPATGRPRWTDRSPQRTASFQAARAQGRANPHGRSVLAARRTSRPRSSR